MKRLVSIALLALLAASAPASEKPMYTAQVDLGDKASLQRGARTFVNYCLSCHSAAFMRFSRMAEDLGLTEEQTKRDLMFVTDKIGSTMEVAMRPADAAQWLAAPPPDLSVIARARGADWLTSYMLTYYVDPARPTGVNNATFKDSAMPHVLWELQGLQRPIVEKIKAHDGSDVEKITGFEVVTPGKQDAETYRRTVRDLVNFLVYVGEPAKLVRAQIGTWVILFLIVFTTLAYLLKREYWKDVH